MTMLLIILLAFITWYLSGFSPGRRIDKEKYRFHAYGVGNKIFGFIDGDSGGLPWVSLPWPFTKPKFQSSWSQFIIGKLPNTNSIGEKIDYGTEISKVGIRYPIITATDITNKIRKQNQHVMHVPIEFPISGLIFDLALPVIFVIEDPIKILPLEDKILPYAQGEVEDALGPWFVEQESNWYETWKREKLENGDQVDPLIERQSLATIVIRNVEGLRIDTLQSITIDNLPLREYLEEKKFSEFGFKFRELSLQIGHGDRVVKILEERSTQQIRGEQTITAIKNEGLQVVYRTTQVNNAEATRDATAKLWEIQKEIITTAAEADATVAGAYKAQVLVLGDKERGLVNQIVGPMIANTITLPKKKEVSNEE